MSGPENKPLPTWVRLLIALPFLAAGAGILTTLEGQWRADLLAYLLSCLCLAAGVLIVALRPQQPAAPGPAATPAAAGERPSPAPAAKPAVAPETRDFKPLRAPLAMPRRDEPAKPGPDTPPTP